MNIKPILIYILSILIGIACAIVFLWLVDVIRIIEGNEPFYNMSQSIDPQVAFYLISKEMYL